jgi:hypothetical protein
MHRELTPEEIAKLLTAEQVAALPDGTTVMIKWGGGNGPAEYQLQKLNGVMWPSYRNALLQDPLTFVGKEPFHNRVWLP